jgi:hypothetical protein
MPGLQKRSPMPSPWRALTEIDRHPRAAAVRDATNLLRAVNRADEECSLAVFAKAVFACWPSVGSPGVRYGLSAAGANQAVFLPFTLQSARRCMAEKGGKRMFVAYCANARFVPKKRAANGGLDGHVVPVAVRQPRTSGQAGLSADRPSRCAAAYPRQAQVALAVGPAFRIPTTCISGKLGSLPTAIHSAAGGCFEGSDLRPVKYFIGAGISPSVQACAAHCL